MRPNILLSRELNATRYMKPLCDTAAQTLNPKPGEHFGVNVCVGLSPETCMDGRCLCNNPKLTPATIKSESAWIWPVVWRRHRGCCSQCRSSGDLAWHDECRLVTDALCSCSRQQPCCADGYLCSFCGPPVAACSTS